MIILSQSVVSILFKLIQLMHIIYSDEFMDNAAMTVHQAITTAQPHLVDIIQSITAYSSDESVDESLFNHELLMGYDSVVSSLTVFAILVSTGQLSLRSPFDSGSDVL